MENRLFTSEEEKSKMKNVFDGFNEQRRLELAKIRTVHQIINKALEHEGARLIKKYGPGHPLTQKINEQHQYYENLHKGLNLEIDRSMIKVPEYEANTLRIDGRVLDQAIKGIKGVSVSLFDENNHWAREFGYVSPDDNGYFSIVVSDQDKKIREKYKYSKLFLTVTDKNRKIVHKEQVPQDIVIGKIHYREVIKGKTPYQEPPGKPTENTENSDLLAAWVIRGQVVNKVDGSGIEKQNIHLFTQKDQFKKQFEPVITDESGTFRFELHPDQHTEFFKVKPEVFLHVLSGARVRYTTKDPIFPEAGKEEEIKIEI